MPEAVEGVDQLGDDDLGGKFTQLGHEDQVDMLHKGQCRRFLMFCISPITHICSVAAVQLRYGFRLYPDTAQGAALARAFGCARVVFNDALGTREEARAAGLAFPGACRNS